MNYLFREDTIRIAEEKGLVVIVRGVEREYLVPLAEALYRGGVRLMEITYDASGKTKDQQTASNIELLVRHFDGSMQIGAGTVLTEEQVELTYRAGGQFVISPDVNPAVIEKTREKDMVSMPGALTPTEITLAHRHGADFVKLFPVTSLGAGYVKAVKAPLSNIRLLAVGGITAENMKEYRKAGAVGFGVGGNLVNREWIKAGNFDAITEEARRFAAAALEV